jgi:type IX secretion system PorP/SprF family membrane protein
MKSIFIILLMLLYTSFFAQDIHLSQFYNQDHLLNPAKIGDYDGDYRFSANYRNQWRQLNKQPISTYLISFDHIFFYKKHQFSAGLMVTSDRFQGEETSYITGIPFTYNVNSNKFLVSLAHSFTYKKNSFRVGIQTGMVMSSSDPSTQTFPNQWDYQSGDFNSKISNLEGQLKPSQNYIDLNLGGSWTKKLLKCTPKIGFSINHINRPKDSYFKNDKERLRARKVFFTEVFIPLSSKYSLQPKLLMMWTAKANDLLIGTNFQIQTSNKIIPSYYVGLHYRHGVSRVFDAIIPTVGFYYQKYVVGLSYDVNLSALSTGTNARKGTFEFSLLYTGASTIPKKVLLPCNRY